MIGDIIENFAIEGGLEITRRGSPTITKGRKTADGSADIFIVDPIVCYPSRPSEIQLLPEGLRTEASVVLFTKEKLNTVEQPNGTEPDQITFEGSNYELHSVASWLTHGGFYVSIGVKVGQ